MKLRKKIPPLTLVNVTHRKPTDPGVIWLIANGYRYKTTPASIFLVRAA